MLIMRLEKFTPGRDGFPPDEGFEAVSRQKDFVRPERDDGDRAVPDEPPDEIAPEVVFLLSFSGGEQCHRKSSSIGIPVWREMRRADFAEKDFFLAKY